MSFLKKLLEQLKAVSELDNGEERDVVLNAVDVISYTGKVDFYESFNKELYEMLDDKLRKDIELNGVKNVKTELDLINYQFEINKLKINLNTVREKIIEISGNTYEMTYSYEEYNGTKGIKDMIVYVK